MTWTDIASGRSLEGTDHSTTAVLGACSHSSGSQLSVHIKHGSDEDYNMVKLTAVTLQGSRQCGASVSLRG